MSRFLMTIDEAVRLTLSASCLPQQGFSLYVLDMGRPVRIFDLAVEMIKRAGRRPFADIDIQFVGVRPGEKLYEELNYEWEVLTPTEVGGVRAAMPLFDPEPKLHLIDQLFAAANARDEKLVKRALIEIVPEYVRMKRQVERQRRSCPPAAPRAEIVEAPINAELSTPPLPETVERQLQLNRAGCR
jgi:O-antigen biosynthesis protein WbqV